MSKNILVKRVFFIVLLLSLILIDYPSALAAKWADTPSGLDLIITNVYTDLGSIPALLTINGQNFDNGDFPVVTLGTDELIVKTFSSNVITAILPDGIPEGDYRLSIVTGHGVKHSDVYNLTIGAVGQPSVGTTSIMTGTVYATMMSSYPLTLLYYGFGQTQSGQSESEAQIPLPRDCTVKSFTLKINNNTFDGPIIFTVRKNGSDTLIKFTIPEGQTGTFFDADSVSFSTSDLYSMILDLQAATEGFVGISYLFEY